MSPAAPTEQVPTSTYAYRVPGGETPGEENPQGPRKRGWLRWVILLVLLASGRPHHLADHHRETRRAGDGRPQAARHGQSGCPRTGRDSPAGNGAHLSHRPGHDHALLQRQNHPARHRRADQRLLPRGSGRPQGRRADDHRSRALTRRRWTRQRASWRATRRS